MPHSTAHSGHAKPRRKNGQDIDMSKFRPEYLSDESSLQDALDEIRRHIHYDACSTLRDLSKEANLLEYILSIVDEEGDQCIRQALHEDIHANASSYSNALAVQLIPRFELYFYFLEIPEGAEPPPPNQYRQLHEAANAVFASLSNFDFCADNDDAEPATKKNGKMSQKQRKAKQRGARRNTLDPTPFDTLSLPVPTTSQEAQATLGAIIESESRVLQSYLNLLRLPILAKPIRDRYIVKNIESGPEAAGNATALTSTKDEVEAEVSGPDNMSDVFPHVQPYKAALYFDSAEGFGDWRIYISTRAERDLRSHSKSGKTFHIIVKKIKELSHGHFSEDNHKRLSGSDNDVPIYEAKMTRDLRLVYRVDCVTSDDLQYDLQVLKIFGIYTHAQLDQRFWDSMAKQLTRRGAEHIRRCTFRTPPRMPGDNVYKPASWPAQPEPEEITQQDDIYIRPEDLEELHTLLALEKFVPFSQALLACIESGQEASHLFDVSKKEWEVILHPSSCFVLGRSGTGKTTTMLFKMFGIERLAQQHGLRKPRQVFVTASSVLAARVEEYFSKLYQSLLTSGEYSSTAETERRGGKQLDEAELVDHDEDDDWRSNLPRKFSELEDKHFPLFLTYDKLCRLLEAEFDLDFKRAKVRRDTRRAELRQRIRHEANGDLHDDDFAAADQASVSPTTPSIALDLAQSSTPITFDKFCAEYWPHFRQELTKAFDPALVFNEIIGIIKGSEQSLKSEVHYLLRQDYLNLSHRTQSTFASQRSDVYTLFEGYLKRKRQHGEYDLADRTHAIIEALRGKGLAAQRFDFLYVDEAQDNLIVDAQLLRALCANPHGLFWAGDTAQTIAVGSSFRFNDLKAFLHRLEEKLISSHVTTTVQPKYFQLSMNYRSHGGIVNCAASVIELITHFWPNSIDILGRERGVVDGLKPIFFTGWDQDTVRYEQFLFGESTNPIEFGANQCILVRNDGAREALRKQVGDIGLILTLYESKGLEFNDVLLFNFFEDSAIDFSQWRVILNLVKSTHNNGPGNVPRFDELRHAGICTELKFLYVAITRARKNLWIVERSEKAEPMKAYWTQRSLIQTFTPKDDIPKLAVESTPEEWAATGRALFHNKRYAQAVHCFERAGRHHEKLVATAYWERKIAQGTSAGDRLNKQRREAFRKAADSFLACVAGSVDEKKTYYRRAGQCFVSSEDFSCAADAFLRSSDYTLSLKCYRQAGMFDEAVEVMQDHKDEIDPLVLQMERDRARVHYFKEHSIQRATDLFETPEDALVFVEDYDFGVARAELLANMDRPTEAAELYLAEGQILKGLQILLDNQREQGAHDAAVHHLLALLWTHVSLGCSPSKDNEQLQELLRLARQLDRERVYPLELAELNMFEAIVSRDEKTLLRLAEDIQTNHGNVDASILSLDEYIRLAKIMPNATPDALSPVLSAYHQYLSLFRKMLLDRTASIVQVMSRLLSIRASSETEMEVPRRSLLDTLRHDTRFPLLRIDEDRLVVAEATLADAITTLIPQYLQRLVSGEIERVKINIAFTSPCFTYTVNGQCNLWDCRREHIDSALVGKAWFTWRIRVQMQQILIIQAADFVLENSGVRSNINRDGLRRDCLLRVFHTLYPVSPSHGSSVFLVPHLVPELSRATNILHDWLEDLAYKLHQHKSEAAMLNSIFHISILGSFIDPRKTLSHLMRSPLVSDAEKQPATFLRRHGVAMKFIMSDLMLFMQASRETFITRGVLFLQHIVDQMFPCDVGCLCVFVELLCASVIVQRSAQSRAPMHDVLIPRAWLFNIWNRFLPTKYHKWGCLNGFLAAVGEVLKDLSAAPEKGYLCLYGSAIPYPARNLFIARICNALCIMGYNFPTSWTRDLIWKTVSSFRPLEINHHPAYARYTSARDWSSLARIIEKTETTQMVEMIHLLDAKNPHHYLRPTGAKTVQFNSIQELPRLLGFDKPLTVFPSKLSATAEPFIPKSMRFLPPEEIAEEDDSPVLGERSTTPAVENTEDVDELQGEDEVSGRQPTEEEERAARLVQQRYRLRKRLSAIAKLTGIKARRAKAYKKYIVQEKKVDMQKGRYRVLFMWALPHLLVYLQAMQEKVENNKKYCNGLIRMGSTQNADEDLLVKVQRLGDYLRQLRELCKKLQPDAEFHKQRDLEQLKALTSQVKGLSGNLPNGEYCLDLDHAVNAILEENKPIPVTQGKPELNTEDIMEA